MYTDDMGRAFKSLNHFAPKGFGLQVIDNEHFLTVKASEKAFDVLDDFNKRRAVEYMARVKQALEQNGAIVLLVREGGKDNV
tara:strand:- start:1428 stop:1673 length:246 start_codon:yes stop_codon:yes gene_type:complete